MFLTGTLICHIQLSRVLPDTSVTYSQIKTKTKQICFLSQFRTQNISFKLFTLSTPINKSSDTDILIHSSPSKRILWYITKMSESCIHSTFRCFPSGKSMSSTKYVIIQTKSSLSCDQCRAEHGKTLPINYIYINTKVKKPDKLSFASTAMVWLIPIQNWKGMWENKSLIWCVHCTVDRSKGKDWYLSEHWQTDSTLLTTAPIKNDEAISCSWKWYRIRYMIVGALRPVNREGSYHIIRVKTKCIATISRPANP